MNTALTKLLLIGVVVGNNNLHAGRHTVLCGRYRGKEDGDHTFNPILNKNLPTLGFNNDEIKDITFTELNQEQIKGLRGLNG
jgi:hypothetical protein